MLEPPFYPSEIRQIDRLVKAALTQPKICQRLLNHDNALCEEFGIAAYTWARLSMIQAHNLQDFCCQILQHQVSQTQNDPSIVKAEVQN